MGSFLTLYVDVHYSGNNGGSYVLEINRRNKNKMCLKIIFLYDAMIQVRPTSYPGRIWASFAFADIAWNRIWSNYFFLLWSVPNF